MATRLTQTAVHNMSTVSAGKSASLEGHHIRQLAVLTAVASWAGIFMAVKFL